MFEIILLNAPTIGFLIMVFMFALVVRTRSKKNNRTKAAVLTKKVILEDSGALNNLPIVLLTTIFVIIGVFVIVNAYLSDKTMSYKIGNTIFGMIFIGFAVFTAKVVLGACFEILCGRYVILKDILKDKDSYLRTNDTNDTYRYYLYFEEFFKKFDEKIRVTEEIFKEAKKNDEFYLVFTKKNVCAFNAKQYELENNSKTVHIDELEGFIKRKSRKKEKKLQSRETVYITEKQIIHDFLSDGHGMTCIANVGISMFLIAVTVGTFWIDVNLFGSILAAGVTAFMIFIAAVKGRYVLAVVSNIKKGKFTVKKDRLKDLNTGVRYKDSNDMVSFRFETYKKLVYSDQKYYAHPVIEEEFYLIFVDGEKEPVWVYQCKNSVLEINVGL